MRRTTPSSKQQSEAPRDIHPQGQPQHREQDTQTRWGGRGDGCTRHVYAPTSPCHRHTQCCDATASAPSQHLGRATPDQPQIPRGQGNLCSLWLKSDGEERVWPAALGPEPARGWARAGNLMCPARILAWRSPRGEPRLGRSLPAPASGGRGRTCSQRNHRGSSPARGLDPGAVPCILQPSP